MLDAGDRAMERKRRTLEPSDRTRRHPARAKEVPGRKLRIPTRAEVRRARDTGAEAAFWQTHQAAQLGPPVRATYRRAPPSEVVHLRLEKSAIRRLKAKAAKAGLPFATYASSVLKRDARS